MAAAVLPTPVLAHILECLGEAGEVIRVASASKCLWAAAAGPLHKVHALVLRCAASDLEPQLLVSLRQRFPNIQQLHVADGSWGWTGSHSLAAWAATLTELRADSTSFLPLVAVVHPQHQHQHQQQLQQHQHPLQQLHGPPLGSALHLSTAATAGTVQPQQQQHAGRCGGRAYPASRHSAASRQERHDTMCMPVPGELRGLTHLQLQHTATSAVKCRQHGSSACDCLDFTALAALLQQNPHLRSLDLSGNSCLPDRLLHAAALAASCSKLTSLSLSGCELVRPGRSLPGAFPALVQLDASDTATTDADVQALADGLPHLQRLALRGCRRVSNYGIDALAAAPALVNGCLTSLDLGGLTRPGPTAMACLTAAWARAFAEGPLAAAAGSRDGCGSSDRGSDGSSSCTGGSRLAGRQRGVQLHVGFARTACITDQVLQPIVAAAAGCTFSFQPPLQQQQQQQQQDSGSGAGVQGLLQQLEQLAVSPRTPQYGSSLQQHHQGQQLSSQVLHAPPVGLCGLHLAGCTGVSSSMLVQLGSCGALATLTSLDLSDTEALKQPAHRQQPQQQQQQQPPPQQQQQQQQGDGQGGTAPPGQGLSLLVTSCGPGSCSSGASRSVLPQLLQHTGQQLQVLLLDGCWIDDAAAAVAAATQGLPVLRELSLVGCRGLGIAGLRSWLGSLPDLRRLSLGGSVSAWSEGPALQDLPVLGRLTELRLVRRPVLRDAELAPLLRQASSLRSLSLVGCYMLTDKVFEMATAAAGAGQSHEVTVVSHNNMQGSEGEGANSEQAGECGREEEGGVFCMPPLQQLTHLSLSACDGICGASIARLQSLRHLRLSFCASLSPAALQHVVVSCRRLQLLELPASLSGQGLGFSVVRFDGTSQPPQQQQQQPGGGNRGLGSAVRTGGGGRGFAGRGRAGAGGMQAGTGVGGAGGPRGLVLPQQAAGQAMHLQQLKVNWLS